MPYIWNSHVHYLPVAIEIRDSCLVLQNPKAVFIQLAVKIGGNNKFR